MQTVPEPRRTELLQQYGLVEGAQNEAAFLHFTELACNIFGMPMAAISIIDEGRIWIKASTGTGDQIDANNEKGLCANAAASQSIYIIEDTSLLAETQSHSWVHGSLAIKFYAGIPLKTKSGLTIGAFCLMNKQAQKFSKSNVAQFSLLAAILMDYIELQYQQNIALSEQHKKIRALAHDLKNPLTIVTLQAELLMDDTLSSDDIVEMSTQIGDAGRKINELINKRLFS